MKKIYTRYHKLYLTDDIVKYKMNTNDLNYLKLYSINSKLNETVPGDIFYTDTKWSIKNNNYFYNGDKYYIIEPGYYYRINSKLTINNPNLIIKLFNKNK